MAAAATAAVPVIELDMAGVTAFRHTEWNHDVTGKNGDLTMSNGAVHNGVRAPTTGARGGIPEFDLGYHNARSHNGYKGTKQVIFRKHDLGLKQPGVLSQDGKTFVPGADVKSRQDYSERCDAGKSTTIASCPFPVASAWDKQDKTQITVKTRVFRVDVEGMTCTNTVAACGCTQMVSGGGNGACQVDAVDFTKRSTYLFKYDATDRSGNHAEQVVFALILDDVHKPMLTLCKSASSTGSALVEKVEGAVGWKMCGNTIADDNIDGIISKRIVYDVQDVNKGGFMAQNKPYAIVKNLLSPDTVGSYLITAKVCDSAGVYGQNSMDNCIEATKDIIISDNAKPWIVMHGDSPHTQECNIAYKDEEATAYDKLDTEANGLHITVHSTQDAANTINAAAPKVGTYAINYNAKDSANNPADEVTRTINVVDTKKPTIALKGQALEVHYEGNAFVEQGISCQDSCDGTLTGTAIDRKWIQCPGDKLALPLKLGSDDTPMSNSAIKSCKFDDKVLGDYVRLYRCVDKSGNANWITRKYVVQDNTKPVITLQGDTPETYDASRTVEYTDKGATCHDTQQHEGTLSRSVEVSGEVVNMKKPGTYTIRYDCQDDSGNQAPFVTRTIVVDDHSCPEIQMLGDQVNYVEAGFPYVDAGATATDDLDGDITSSIVVDGDVVDTAGAFYSRKSCREIKQEYCHLTQTAGRDSTQDNRASMPECTGPNTGMYFVTTHAQGAYTRQSVWCDFTTASAYTYYPCSGCDRVVRDGSKQGSCANVGLEMATVFSTAAKGKFAAHFFGTTESDMYLCSTNDQANTDVSVNHWNTMDAATWAAKTTRAEAGKYVIEYHVKDASQNKECTTPKRTVIVRDTLPPVISLHLDKKLIHVSDATQTGLSNAQNSAQANRAGDAAYNPNLKDMLMAEQSSASTNSWLLAAAASAVTGLALLSFSSKRATPVTVPV